MTHKAPAVLRTILALVMLAAAFVIVLAAGLPERAAYTGDSFSGLIPIAPEIGAQAPGFTAATLDGGSVTLAALRGRMVILNFWATWCGPCRREIPDFVEIYGKYKEKGLEIVGVSLDDGGWDDVNPYLQKTKINYHIVVGDGKLAMAYGNIQAIPTTFIVDKQGNIVDRHVGLMTKAQLEAKLKNLL